VAALSAGVHSHTSNYVVFGHSHEWKVPIAPSSVAEQGLTDALQDEHITNFSNMFCC